MGLFPSSLNKDKKESFTRNAANTNITNDIYYDRDGNTVLEIENDQPDRYFDVISENGNWLVTNERNSAPKKRGISAVRSPLWDGVDNSLNITDPFWGGTEYQLGKVLENRLLYTSYALRNKSVALNDVNPTRLKLPFGNLKVNTKLAFKTVKALKIGGAALGVVGIGMSTTELFDGISRGDKSAILKGSLGIVAGVIGFAGPVGLGVSVAYALFVEPRLFPDE